MNTDKRGSDQYLDLDHQTIFSIKIKRTKILRVHLVTMTMMKKMKMVKVAILMMQVNNMMDLVTMMSQKDASRG